MKVLNLPLDNTLNSILDYSNNSKFRVEFKGSFLKLDKVTFACTKIINFYTLNHCHTIMKMF